MTGFVRNGGDPSTLALGCRPFFTEKEPLALSPGVSNLGMTWEGDTLLEGGLI